MVKENGPEESDGQEKILSSSQVQQIRDQYERKIFDLEQLLEITKSLNSTMDFNKLIDSILLTCMAHLRVAKAGVFLRKTMDSEELFLNRHFQGFDLDEKIQYIIPDEDPLIQLLKEKPRPITLDEAEPFLTRRATRKLVESLNPIFLVPLLAKDQLEGLLLLAEPLTEQPYSPEEKEFLTHIALSAAIAVNNAYLFEMTSTDLLTRLKMRHFAVTRLKEEIFSARKEGRPLSLVIADIDKFKDINDTYGHSAGDEVLQQVAGRILENIRPEDTAGRYGGEEFIIILPDIKGRPARKIAERIRQAVEKKPVAYGKLSIEATISLGLTELSPTGTQDLKELIDRADKAMYVSKKGGRNRVTLRS